MNNSTQAQKGFKTFLLTLSISLIVFSVIYFVITNNSSSKVNLDANVESNAQQAANNPTANAETTPNEQEIPGEVAGATVGPEIPVETVQGPTLAKTAPATVEKDSKETVFGKIAAAKPTVQARAVLAATTAASQSTLANGTNGSNGNAVPNGGTVSITFGLILSLLAFAGGMFVIYKDPRRMALVDFEKRAVKDLE